MEQRSPFLRRDRAILLVGAIVCLATLAGSWWMIARARQDAIRSWKTYLDNYSVTIGQHALQTLTAADLVLKRIGDRVHEAGIENEADLRRAMGTREVYDMILEKAHDVPQIDVATIVASNGDVINFSRSYPPPPINLADRDYFVAHARDPKLEVFLSAPVQNRGTGDWTFYLARKIRGSDGQPLGLVLTGIRSGYFSDFFQRVSLGHGSAIALFRRDGVLLARWPERQDLLGGSFADATVFRRLARNGTPGSFVTEGASFVDPAERGLRIVSPRPIAEYPLTVNVVAGERLILRDWRRTALFVGSGATALAVLIALLALWLARLTRREQLTLVQLDAAREVAEAATRAKSNFLATMSHEIRTPLNAMVGMSDVLLGTRLDTTQRTYVRTIATAGAHLISIVNEILDFSGLEAERIRLAPVATELRPLVADVIEMTRALPGAGELAVTAQLPPELPEAVVVDAGRLKQVLINLLGNAVKFTERGRVELRVRPVEQETDRVRLRFTVEDTGSGITPEAMGRIFQPFERAVPTLVAGRGGTGLGLAISRRLVEAMGGEIGCDSTPGDGSRFWFELPLRTLARPPAPQRGEPVQAPAPLPVAAMAPAPGEALAGPAAKPQPEDAAPPPRIDAARRPLRILVAEDTPANQAVIRAMLERLGHRVEVVSNGAEAVAAAAATPYDVILMDIQMPVLDGFEAARRIRALGGPWCRLPIIAVTAFVEPLDLARARAAGMTDHLSKPLRIAELSRMVERHGGRGG